MIYISINAHTIRKNAKHNTNDPPIRIAKSKNDSKPIYANRVVINGPSELAYSPDKPIMKCGARLVLVVPNDNDVSILK